jgi:hypothetical protein
MAALCPSGITGYVWNNLNGIQDFVLKEIARRVAITRGDVVVGVVAVVPAATGLAAATRVASTWGAMSRVAVVISRIGVLMTLRPHMGSVMGGTWRVILKTTMDIAVIVVVIVLPGAMSSYQTCCFCLRFHGTVHGETENAVLFENVGWYLTMCCCHGCSVFDPQIHVLVT